MRYLLIVKSTGQAEAGLAPGREYNEAVTMYKQELAKAGILLAAEELEPSASGVRITYSSSGEEPRVQAGPFPADHSLVAEYALIDAGSEDEALKLAFGMPVPATCGEFQIELRRLKDAAGAWREPRLLTLESDLENHLHMFKKRI